MLIYLAELEHGNYIVSFAGRRYHQPTHTLDSPYVALPPCVFPTPFFWKMELFLCLYHDACVLRMSLLYFAFEVRSVGTIASASVGR